MTAKFGLPTLQPRENLLRLFLRDSLKRQKTASEKNGRSLKGYFKAFLEGSFWRAKKAQEIQKISKAKDILNRCLRQMATWKWFNESLNLLWNYLSLQVTNGQKCWRIQHFREGRVRKRHSTKTGFMGRKGTENGAKTRAWRTPPEGLIVQIFTQINTPSYFFLSGLLLWVFLGSTPQMAQRWKTLRFHLVFHEGFKQEWKFQDCSFQARMKFSGDSSCDKHENSSAQAIMVCFKIWALREVLLWTLLLHSKENRNLVKSEGSREQRNRASVSVLKAVFETPKCL